jgi:uncharacterized protein
MNRREAIILSGLSLAGSRSLAQGAQGRSPKDPEELRVPPPKITVYEYRPKSLYRTPEHDIKKAKFPIFDAHCHGPRPVKNLPEWVKLMDKVGVEKTIVFSGLSSPEKFEEFRKPYDQYPGRFDLWCAFDMTGVNQPGFGPQAVKTLEACHRAGARGVGEIHDKGLGLYAPIGTGPGASRIRARIGPSPHADDPRLDVLWDRSGQLGMPISIHVSDPIWCYYPMTKYNDGLWQWLWEIDMKQPGIWDQNQLVDSLDRTAQKHPKTIFIACHLMQLDYDLTRLGQLFDRNPNLYADIAARYTMVSEVPRFANQFLRKYPDRILYGTDVPYNQVLFSTTFRILETSDEHFYGTRPFYGFPTMYYWPLNGLDLPDDVLKKVYRDNILSVIKKAQNNAA